MSANSRLGDGTEVPKGSALRIGIVVGVGPWGGAEHYLEQLAEQALAAGHHVTFIGNFPASRVPPGCAIKPVPLGPKWGRRSALRSLFRARYERRVLLQSIGEQSFDLLHLQFKREQILLSRHIHGTAVVWTEHGEFPTGLPGMVLRPMYRRAAQGASAIICVSKRVQDSLFEFMPEARSKVSVVPNGVDTKAFATTSEQREVARREFGLPADVKVILIASRLDPAKGTDRIVAALDHLPENYVLLVAGRGPLSSNFETLAANRPSRIKYLGFVSDIHPAMAAADLFALPSTAGAHEGLPTAMLQAMAAGLPVVVTSDSGVADWLGDAGVSSDPAADTLASAIQIAMSRRADLRARSLSRSAKHDIKTWWRDTAALLKPLLSPDPPLVLFEPNFTGHRMNYVTAIVDSTAQTVVLATSSNATSSEEFRERGLGARGNLTLHDVGALKFVGRDRLFALWHYRRARMVRRQFPRSHMVVLEGDKFVAFAAFLGGFGSSGLKTTALCLRAPSGRGMGVRSKLLLLRLSGRRGVSIRALAPASPIAASYSIGSLPATPDPVEFSPSASLEETFESTAGKAIVGIFGNISSRKNLGLVLQAVLDPSLVGTTLVIAGKVDPDEQTRHSTELSELRRDGRIVELNRFLTDEELDTAVSRCDVAVMAHSSDGPSGIFGKALAAGTPIVAGGAATLKREAHKYPDHAIWVPLEKDDLVRAITESLTRESEPVAMAGNAAFTTHLLGPKPAKGPEAR